MEAFGYAIVVIIGLAVQYVIIRWAVVDAIISADRKRGLIE